MKTIILFLSLIFTSTCFAEIYVITDKATNEVITVSEKNDTVIGQGQELKIVSGKLSDFTDENPTNFKLSGTKFVKNISKIDKQEQAKIQEAEKQAEEKLIVGKMREQAIEALKSEGKLDVNGKVVK
jgi:hypothetical protein